MSAADLSAPRHVGFVGLGDQGFPMARAVADAGFELHVWARRPGSLDPLVTSGTPHVAHDALGELAAACELVEICVSTDADTAAVAADLFPRLPPGAVVVDHGTGTPVDARALAGSGAVHGVEVLDAPVSGGRPGAEARALTVLVGGEAAALDRARPVLEAFSAHVVHLGGHGAGQVAKLMNNTLLALNQAAIADVLGLATTLGVDAGTLADALALGSASSRALTLFGTMVTSSTVDHLSAVQMIDMGIVEDVVRDAGADPSGVVDRAREGIARMRAVVEALGHTGA